MEFLQSFSSNILNHENFSYLTVLVMVTTVLFYILRLFNPGGDTDNSQLARMV